VVHLRENHGGRRDVGGQDKAVVGQCM
jgi:hypothetical protein